MKKGKSLVTLAQEVVKEKIDNEDHIIKASMVFGARIIENPCKLSNKEDNERNTEIHSQERRC